MKKEPIKNCPCGGAIEKKTETYRTNGQDAWTQWLECAECGEVWGTAPKQEAPCFICGATPQIEVFLDAEAEIATGFREWVPGLPNNVNLCGNPDCRKDLHKLIDNKLDEFIEN